MAGGARLLRLFLAAAVLPFGCDFSTSPGDAGDADAEVAREWDLPPDPGRPENLILPDQCTGAFRVEDLEGNPAVPPEGDLEYLFDQGSLRTYAVEVEESDWAWLESHAIEERFVPANLVFEGLRYRNVGIRYKGAWSTLKKCFDETGKKVCSKLSLKLRFDRYDPCGRFYGLRRLVFNASQSDSSMMRARLMYNLMRKIGLMASRSAHALLSVNAAAASVYALVEPVDEEYLVSRFEDPTGNLYKEGWPIHEDEYQYLQALRTNENHADVHRMLELMGALKTATDETAEEVLAPFLDLGNVARMVAFSTATMDKDGFTRFWCEDMFTPCPNHSFYWYDEPGGLIRLLPWDQDITFFGYKTADKISPDWWEPPDQCIPVPQYVLEEDPDPTSGDYSLVFPPQCDKLLRFSVAKRRVEYLDTLADMSVALTQSMEDLEALRTLLREPLTADPLYGFTMEEWEDNVLWLKKKMGQQKAEIESLLAQER
jgi:hypothetical protein